MNSKILSVLSLLGLGCLAIPMVHGATPAKSTEAFLNLLGVNTHLDGNSGWNTNATQVGQQMAYIGVRLERDWPHGITANGDAFRTAQLQNPLGRLWTSIGDASPAGQRSALLDCETLYNNYGPGLVYAMGGPNEEDTPYPQGLGARLPDSALVQQSLYDWAHPLGINVGQMEFGAGWTATNNYQGDYNPTNPGINSTTPLNGDQRYTPGSADFGGAHTYLINTTTTPAVRLATLRTLALLTTPGKSVATTEWGAYTYSGLSNAVFGQYMVAGAFDAAAAGDSAYIIYGLQDGAIEGTYGFFTSAAAPNPVATYFHNLITVLQCADEGLRYAPGQTPTFTPGALNVSYANTSTAAHYLMQKPTGEYVIAAYSEQLMNGAQAGATDTINFGQVFGTVQIYDVQTGLAPIATLSNVSSCDLALSPSDTYLIVLSNATPPSPDFSVAVSPVTQTLVPSGSTSYSVTIGATNGFADDVSLSVTGLPAGASGTFSPSTLAGNGVAVLTISTDANTPTGTNALTISGHAGSLAHDASATLTVNAPGAPVAPTGLAAIASDGQVACTWNPVGNATSYILKRSATSGGPYTTVATGVTTVSYLDPAAGDAGYFFVVSAVNTFGESGNSAALAPTVIVDNSDAAGVTIVGAWSSSSNATGFYGPNYLYTNGPGKSVHYVPTLAASRYVVYARWTANANRDASVPFDISYAGGTTTVHVNQQDNGGVWAALGTFAFDAGSTGSVLLRTQGTTAVVVADAIEFVPVDDTPPPPDFGLALAPASQTVTAGEATTYTVTTTVANGFAGTVNLSVDGLPSGATAVFTPATINGSGSALLQVSTDSAMASGNGAFTVTGTSSGLVRTASATLGVNGVPTVPAAPAGLTASAGNTQVTLSWTAVSGATSYTLKRAAAASGPYAVIFTGVTGTSITDTGLTNGTSYFYVVSATNAVGEGADSAAVSAVPQSLGIIKDNADPTGVVLTGSWAAGTGVAGFYGSNYLSAGTVVQSGNCTAKFTPTIAVTGTYDVYCRWAASSNRATNAPFDINSAGGTTTVTVNEQVNNGTWMLLGSFPFNAGTTGNVVIRNNGGANGYVVADAVQWVLKPAAPATITLVDLAQTFDGSPKAVSVTTAPAGLATTVTYNGSATPPTAAGSYAVSAIVAEPSYAAETSGTLVIAPATPLLAWTAPTPISYGEALGAAQLNATANVAGSFAYTPSAGTVLDAGPSQPLTATFTPADPINYAPAIATTAVAVNPAPATVTLGALAQTYDGTSKMVTVTTIPAGLPVTVSYNGNAAAPTDAGSYSVLATVATPNYSGAAAGSLVIDPASATLTLAPLAQLYDGTPRVVTATTMPQGLPMTISYNGADAAPIYPGSYAVVATIDDPNYQGTAAQSLEVTTTALVRHAPTLNGIVVGSLQMLAAENVALNSSASVSGDLLAPGTPAVQLNGQPIYAGTLDGPGNATPDNAKVTLNSGAVLRHVVRRIDAVAVPTANAPMAPSGTRDAILNNSSQTAGDFSTLRHLTLNSNVGAVAVPPGAYGNFTANSGSQFVLGVAGSTDPAIYYLQNLTLNSNSGLQIVGPVTLTLAHSVSLNASAGNPAHPGWLTLQVFAGGVTLNGRIEFDGHIVAPTGVITVNGGADLVGTVVSDRLVLNGNALLNGVVPQ